MSVGSLFIWPSILLLPEFFEGGDLYLCISSVILAVTHICWMSNFETEVSSWRFYCLQSLYLSFFRTYERNTRWMVIFLIIPVVLECIPLKWSKLEGLYLICPFFWIWFDGLLSIFNENISLISLCRLLLINVEFLCYTNVMKILLCLWKEKMVK